MLKGAVVSRAPGQVGESGADLEGVELAGKQRRILAGERCLWRVLASRCSVRVRRDFPG